MTTSTGHRKQSADFRYSLPFERIDDPIELTLFLQRYWHHTITISALYFLAIKGIQRWMRDRPAYQLQKPLFLWNAALAVFSIIGFLRFSE
uniref:Elongation of very long chain fatty acids protein n=1 Tax=Steinernema glaseri TaxID=37863 RepID=A0A1I7Y9K5_9BILA